MRFKLLVLLLLVPLARGEQRKISHEEEVVRTAYAKLSFAAEIGMVWHAAMQDRGWPKLSDNLILTKAMNNQIRFDLSGFKVGKVSDISLMPWSSLVEGPVSILYAHCQEIPFGIETPQSKKVFNITYSDGAWQEAALSATEKHESLSDHAPSPLVPTVGDILSISHKPSGGGEWSRYASYSVVATLRERSISYRATFLFKGSGDAEEIVALDYATGMGVGTCIGKPMYPSALVDTAFREIPFIQAWIVASEITDCKKLKEPEVCCDPATWRCGIASEDIRNSMKVAIDPDTRSLINSRMKIEGDK